MRGCDKDVPLAVNHPNRCAEQTANQNSSNEMRPAWKLSIAVLFRRRARRVEGDGGGRGRASISVFHTAQEVNVLSAS